MLSLVIVAMMCVVTWPAEAAGNAPDDCQAARLAARVSKAEIRFAEHDQPLVQATANTSIVVEADKWPLARDLMLGEDSKGYRTAMRCLLRGPGRSALHRDEWRFSEPSVTAEKNRVTVDYTAIAWLKSYGPVLLGPWRIDVEKKKNWMLDLQPPTTLVKIPWEHIEIQLGGLSATDIRPQVSSADETKLVWSERMPRDVRVEVNPPWQRSEALDNQVGTRSKLGAASWWACVALLIAAVTLLVLRPYPAPVPGTRRQPVQRFRRWVGGGGTTFRESPAIAVLQWAALSLAVAVMLFLLTWHVFDKGLTPWWRAHLVIAAALVLVLVARPSPRVVSPAVPHTTGDHSGRPETLRNRRPARVVIWTASVAASLGLLVLWIPFFGLAAELSPKPPSTVPGLVGLAVLGLVTLWLWLAAIAAWAWRFLQEGELVPKSWTRTWNSAPARCLTVVGALLLLLAAAMTFSFWEANKHQQKRVRWLMEQSNSDTYKFLVEFPQTGITWLYAYTWVLTGLAFLALMHFRVKEEKDRLASQEGQMSLGPTGLELLLTAAVFSLVLGLRHVAFANFIVLYGLWLALNILSLYLVLAVGRRRSVLRQAGETFCAHWLSTTDRRGALLQKAREYRDLHQRLYGVDHGHAEGATRKELENDLRVQRQSLIDVSGGSPLGNQVSVMDIAMGWGPEYHWWDNALYAARLAFWFGIPFSGALVWLNNVKDYDKWFVTLHDPIGIPEIVVKFITFQVAWTGAGFVLGALWRLLPGHRSPVRALSLTVAYAIPVSLGAWAASIKDAGIGYAFLNVLLLLIVLTLTSMWMDMATFSEERLFWPTRYGLLLSIYQMRGVSTQVAYLLTQVTAAVLLWRQLSGGMSQPRQ
ncbi:DUF6185 family protein [Streptomyces sp. NPDC001315]|uniref:DUF6185 family protein n=1 Tax=Streptomyces sp. NPDC001315 TaxID=3364562 RepID=UPI00368EF4E4